MDTQKTAILSSIESLDLLFDTQKKNQYIVAVRKISERKKLLKKLLKTYLSYQNEIAEALQKDLQKPLFEVKLSEILPVVLEIKHAIQHIERWTTPEKMETPLTLIGTKSWIYHEPKGVVLIISPWNFPFNLSFIPLVSAISGGNCVILKTSEISSNSSKVIKKICEEVFDINEVAVVEGDGTVASYLTSLPFDHIFFTGSTNIGKKVMEAASQNLASVTLELGGKSPVIVDKSANIKKAAHRIVQSKFSNTGQTCIAPDYIFVHEKVKEKLASAIEKKIDAFYGNVLESEDYGRIINYTHFKRLKTLLKNGIEHSQSLDLGVNIIDEELYFSPTILMDVERETMLMKQEIFGPILPILTYETIEEVIEFIRQKEKPLALYIYSNSDTITKKIIAETRAGTTVVNHSVIQYVNPNIPFGGVGASGIGGSHGYFGFCEFTHARSVVKQVLFFSTLDFFVPPYTRFKERLINFSIKWL